MSDRIPLAAQSKVIAEIRPIASVSKSAPVLTPPFAVPMAPEPPEENMGTNDRSPAWKRKSSEATDMRTVLAQLTASHELIAKQQSQFDMLLKRFETMQSQHDALLVELQKRDARIATLEAQASTMGTHLDWVQKATSDQLDVLNAPQRAAVAKDIIIKVQPGYVGGAVAFGSLAASDLKPILGLSPDSPDPVILSRKRPLATDHTPNSDPWATGAPCGLMRVQMPTAESAKHLCNNGAARRQFKLKWNISVEYAPTEYEAAEKSHLQKYAMPTMLGDNKHPGWRFGKMVWMVESPTGLQGFATLSKLQVPVGSTEQDVRAAVARAESWAVLRAPRAAATPRPPPPPAGPPDNERLA
jgi:hypothetical protein